MEGIAAKQSMVCRGSDFAMPNCRKYNGSTIPANANSNPDITFLFIFEMTEKETKSAINKKNAPIKISFNRTFLFKINTEKGNAHKGPEAASTSPAMDAGINEIAIKKPTKAIAV